MHKSIKIVTYYYTLYLATYVHVCCYITNNIKLTIYVLLVHEHIASYLAIRLDSLLLIGS